MMTYEEFEDAILKGIKIRMGDGYKAETQKVARNNGLMLNSITIKRQGDRVSPVIDLEPYFEKYNKGMDMEEILAEIPQIYEGRLKQGQNFVGYSFDFDQLKNRVIFRLICQEENMELLSDIPNTPYLDLAIVYYVLWDTDDLGQSVVLIHNAHLKKWGVTKEELHRLAEVNTERLCPASIRTIQDVMYDMIKAVLGEEAGEFCNTDELDEGGFQMFVLTNEKSLNGACCILYEDLLGKFAEEENTDIIILPSSVHEMLLIPDWGEISYEEISSMVTEINQSEVLEEDRLSNQIYRYSRSSGTIDIVFHSEKCLIERAPEKTRLG